MKKIIFLITLTLSLNSLAQTFKLQKNTNRADLEICQENHNRILNKYANQADSQIARLINGLTIESKSETAEYKMELYKIALGELLMKRIMISELTKQLNTVKLAEFYIVKENYNKAVLNPDSIKLDLIGQYESAIDRAITSKNLKIGKKYLSGLKTDLALKAFTILLSKRFRKIGAGLFARIIANQTGKIASTAVLKSVSVSFGSKLFVSMGTGILLNLLTFPLHAYRLPPEHDWTNLLTEYPELIMVPEWMKKGGIDDHPWMAHCNAIQRRTTEMEKHLKRSLKLDETEFISSMAFIGEMEDPETEEVRPDNYYHSYETQIDNTAVKNYTPFLIKLAPSWAYKLN